MIIEKWKNSQTYVIGKSHINANEVCQDRTYYASRNGVHVIALADGAGSRKRSELGAETVTKTICELMVSHFMKCFVKCEKRGKSEEAYLDELKGLKREILKVLLNELDQTAKREELTLQDLSSTLLFCAIYQNKYIIGHIGDGAIGGLFEEDEGLVMKTLSEPRNGEASNITFFVTDSNAIDNLRISSGEFNKITGIILMSDGPADVFYHKTNGFHDNTIKLFENFYKKDTNDYNKILSQLLSEKIAQMSSDDLSLNVLYLEKAQVDQNDPYTTYLLKDIKSKEQITNKSRYSVFLDPSINGNKQDFITLDDVRSYLKWS